MIAPGTNPIPSMQDYRKAQWLAMACAFLHEGLHNGRTASQSAELLAREQRALAAAITEVSFIALAAATLLKAQAAQAPSPDYIDAPEQARESIAQILRRRAAEANEFAAWIETPEHIQELAKLSVADAQARVPDFTQVKTQDVLHDLLHLDGGKPQVIAHIDAAAKGTMLEHRALMQLFEPHGELHHPLMDALARHLPQTPKERLHTLALEWLTARHKAAKITVELASNSGASYREAVLQSTLAHQPGNPNSAPPAVHATMRLPMQLTPREMEHEKTRFEKAQDVAYTMNHALSCGFTDIVTSPLISGLFGVSLGCLGHTHADGHHHHDHHHPTHEEPSSLVAKIKNALSWKNIQQRAGQFSWKEYRKEAVHYFKGEIIGDFVAVPLTIGVQRLFPGFMQWLNKLCEPLAAPFFRRGAKHAAEHWGARRGLAEDSGEVEQRAAKIYHHEMSHLSQAVMWNMFAFPAGMIAQKMGGHDVGWGKIFLAKLSGAIVSNAMLLGGRAMAPETAERIDRFNSRHFIEPVTGGVMRLLGNTPASRVEAGEGAALQGRIESAAQEAAPPAAAR